MATTVEEFNGVIAQVATDIGDLMERQDASEGDITALQDAVAAIDLTSIISNNPAATGTNIAWSVDVVTSKLAEVKTQIIGGAPEAYDTLGKVGTEIDLLKGRVDLLETKMAALEAKFDNNGVLKAEHIPSYITDGMTFKGMFDATADSLPVSSNDTDGDFYKVSVAGTVNVAAGATAVHAGDTIMSDGDAWYVIGRDDLVTSVNGQTGAVVLTAPDLQYTASLDSGLNATDVAGALNELGKKVKDFLAAFGDPAAITTAAGYLAMRNAAATDGVQPSPVPSV